MVVVLVTRNFEKRKGGVGGVSSGERVRVRLLEMRSLIFDVRSSERRVSPTFGCATREWLEDGLPTATLLYFLRGVAQMLGVMFPLSFVCVNSKPRDSLGISCGSQARCRDFLDPRPDVIAGLSCKAVRRRPWPQFRERCLGGRRPGVRAQSYSYRCPFGRRGLFTTIMIHDLFRGGMLVTRLGVCKEGSSVSRFVIPRDWLSNGSKASKRGVPPTSPEP